MGLYSQFGGLLKLETKLLINSNNLEMEKTNKIKEIEQEGMLIRITSKQEWWQNPMIIEEEM